jgi:DNA repair photolyase
MQTKVPTGTREWAVSNVNLATGCSHKCWYCYAREMAVRFGRTTAVSWGDETINEDKVTKTYAKRKGRVMLPSTHDITPRTLGAVRAVLRKLLSSGNEVLVVSKPHLACITALCQDSLLHRDQVMFRFTIGSASDKTLALWEPGAPRFSERLRALQYAHQHGYQTSVSMEPMLDVEPGVVVEQARPYITDALWFGRVAGLKRTLKINGASEKVKQAGVELQRKQSDEWVWELYRWYSGDPMIKFKDSVKTVVGIAQPTVAGLDI